MPSYDPKRPRPSATADDIAPIEAILDPSATDATPPDAIDDASDVEPIEPIEEVEEVEEVDLRVGPGAGSPEPLLQAGGSEVPIAPAPEENTANRAVLAAVLVGVAALVAVIVVVRRRRG